MTSPDGDALIRAASPADHHKAVQMLLDVHEARLALGNATLQSIADKLEANEQSIVAGTAAVKGALTELDNLTQILNTVSNLITIVGQIVAMV
jgi:hypothetical protein